ncbi:MAG: ATP-binding cassette domain-containing protein [Oscillospiraceae bacterium]|jgi:ABC-type multidrug transport system ATPase subunit|nr:ATP-binding cassette domain-containing protein [Oscillospiraceae bacterium]
MNELHSIGLNSIELNSIQKSYQGRTVLDLPESLTFLQGNRYALMGPNGSGKSTLLRLIAGLLTPDSGSIMLPDDLRNNCGYLPQTPYIFDTSVLSNVTLAGCDKKAARDILVTMGLSALAAQNAKTLSGGEKQRLCLARMLIRSHKLLLLDEPISAQDRSSVELVANVLETYLKETDCTLIIATHTPRFAELLCCEIIHLENGKRSEA